ncbi:helix-turn-helix domain-containing protein, partial [Streptococcus pneumoniae]|nr:helix-turn-helix domain-containing protein [Streptococcus pneumoniae]
MQEKLLILRKKQGISQQELADYLKISVTSYG